MFSKALPAIVLLLLFYSCASRQSAGSVGTEPETARTYQLRGNEPFWNITVEPSAITFNELGELPLVYPYRSPVREKGTVIFETGTEKDGKKSLLKIRITEEACTDNMSGEKFPYTVVVEKDDRSLNGCGN